ncbi:hypothetical protein L9F63_009587 [Diploptera punctata]|uniref:Fatty acid synthase n=1 Tax=Diploptera punctata TaxID=6984 RepID=A0AAD8AJC6_DIPPU|nr:hypothetical protein L9F63_009587 [Diploptera punctata]
MTLKLFAKMGQIHALYQDLKNLWEQFLKMLQQKGILTQRVKTANTVYHSKVISSIAPVLLQYLKKIIPNPKQRSSRWLSSSVSGSAPLAALCSAEYYTNNLLNTVLFDQAMKHIPVNAIVIEISPHGFMHNVMNQSVCKTVTHISLTQYGHEDNVCMILTSLGRLFELGLQLQLTQLYPPVQYPVSRGTPMISPLVRWIHSQDWYVPLYESVQNIMGGETSVKINIQEEENEHLSGHVIDGRNLFPAMGYMVLVWDYFSRRNGNSRIEEPVIFKNLRFHRATNIPKEGNIEFTIALQRVSGKFEIMEGGAIVVSGRVHSPEDISQEMVDVESLEEELEKKQVNGLIDLNSRDIYKELRLRGYNYCGLFRSLVSVDNKAERGIIKWCDNWIAFMDNMLQMKILQGDSRCLFVPTFMRKVTIDVKKHIAYLKKCEAATGKPDIPVYSSFDLNLIWSGGIQIEGMKANAIARRKPLSEPVLEKYIFVANTEPEEVDMNTTLRICMHIALENLFGNQVKTLELYKQDKTLLSPQIVHILGDLPLIQADITILADPDDPAFSDLDVVGYKIEDRKLSNETNCILIIASEILQDPELLKIAINALAEGACILTREKLNMKQTVDSTSGVEIIFQKSMDDEIFVLLKKKLLVVDPIIIEVKNDNYDWLPKVQTAINNNSNQHILLVAQGEEINGILGLVNCIRKEPGGENVRCVFIPDKMAPKFDYNLKFYRDQLNKDIAVNIYKNGKWGTYRHIPLECNALVTVPYAYCNVLIRGDLSTLKWIEGNLDTKRCLNNSDEELIYIYYSPLNFRDVMTATGKISLETLFVDKIKDCDQGMEFSGRDQTGRRVMGMLENKSFATMAIANTHLVWDVPDHWSLEEAATVPVVYSTVYYALTSGGQLKKGDSILIHAGSGGVGQAAISVCLHAGCIVYTTVGTPEKREFIKNQFPQLTDENIGNSRDTSFEELIMVQTKGRGVDIVLNSLAEEKLQASLRCLAVGGRFLEIGKFDLESNNFIGMELFLKQTSFHGIMLDLIFKCSDDEKIKLHKLVSDGIKSGAVRPLTRTIFPYSDVEQAFRYLAAGKHIGKVLLQIRPEETEKLVPPVPLLIDAIPRYICLPDNTYIITGGLGGLGLELADWLVLRGARKLILTSRTGLRTGYQSSRIRIWQRHGVKVQISLADITTETGVKELLSEAIKLGPVDAIFNLAVVLKDALLVNQTEENFIESAGPKPIATHYLDVLSRKLCPELRHFVVFSSVSCGRGNAGQTNYGMNNSIMERICEARVRDGLPALAVQWGAVGDVGLVADMQEENTEIVIGGTLPQKINSCLEELDRFLKQPHPVVASMVVAEKRAGRSNSVDVVSSISNILGITDLKGVSLHVTLVELGMDSMMAVEIKQVLEREFEIFLTPQEIRKLTLTTLKELSQAKKETEPKAVEPDLSGLQLLLHTVGDEKFVKESVLHLPSAIDTDNGPILIMLPGVEGTAGVLKSVAKNLKYKLFCLQYGYDTGETIQEIALSLLQRIEKILPPNSTFDLLGYSFGGLLALEMAHHLEKNGWEGHVHLIDSAPYYSKNMYIASLGTNEDKLEINLLHAIWAILAQNYSSSEFKEKLAEQLSHLKTYREKLDHFLTLIPPTDYSLDHLRNIGMSSYIRLKALGKYDWTHEEKIKSKTTLIRPTAVSLVGDKDYGLSKICEKTVDVSFVTGNHVTVLDNEETAVVINSYLTNKC